MLISDSNKFIFIHNPKCAGTSIFKALLPYSNYICRFSKGQGRTYSQIGYYIRLVFGEHKILSNFRYHISAKELKELLGEERWNAHLTFGVVRNPYDRLISNFKYISKRPSHYHWEQYNTYGNFKVFVLNLHDVPWKDFQHHYLAANGKIVVKKILRFESINSDFKNLISKMGLPDIPLQKFNVSQRKADFLSYYDPEMIEIVNDVFDEDFRLFGYEKTKP